MCFHKITFFFCENFLKSSPIFVAIRVRPIAPHEDSDECCVDVQDTNGGAVISLSGNSRKLEVP